MSSDVERLLQVVRSRAPHEPEFHQAVAEVAHDVLAVERSVPAFASGRVLERLTVPDRMISFRVVWRDDGGDLHVQRGWRVQMSNALGPYKGGLRFHPTVSPSVLKFLAFEQVFKNALTGLPLGGGKGGSDFDPRGRSDGEIERFCVAFMAELVRSIGPGVDVPAGDINVGGREIGWLFGAYKKLVGRWDGALTGKPSALGGSALRPEATGYGLLYFVRAMLAHVGEELSGKRVVVSGKGNVATYAVEKAMALGARVLALSDTSGTLGAPGGFDTELLAWVRERKAAGGDLSGPPDGAVFHPGRRPWSVACDIALPCATQNELGADDARALADNGCRFVVEGANMPCTAEAIEVFRARGVRYAPGKASNAGGVAVSGLEMAQNAQGLFWTSEEVDGRLEGIMDRIHARVVDAGTAADGSLDYAAGANIAAYRRVAEAVVAQGTFG